MTAPTLPTATPAAAPATAATNPAAAEVSSGDFLLMLGQLIGAPVAQTTGQAKPLPVATTDKDQDAEQATQDAATVTGVPLSLMTTLPQPVAATDAPAATAVLELVGVQGGESKALSESSSKATELSATLLDAVSKDANASAQNSAAPQQLPALDSVQQLRTAATADSATSRPMQHPVGTSAWADELGTRMVMMSERGQHSASLRLSPEHLGPLEVRISVRDDQASVWFGASHADTRAALEQALPRLRELFATQGMSLADAGVHHQTPRDQSRTPTSAGSNAADPSVESVSGATAVAVKLGLVDAYA